MTSTLSLPGPAQGIAWWIRCVAVIGVGIRQPAGGGQWGGDITYVVTH